MESKNGHVKLTMNGRSSMPPLSAIRRADDSKDYRKRIALGVLFLLVIYVIFFEALVLGVVMVICLVTLVIASMLMNSVMSLPLGDEKMRAISSAIREGSDSFFFRVYGTISKLAIPMAIVRFLSLSITHFFIKNKRKYISLLSLNHVVPHRLSSCCTFSARPRKNLKIQAALVSRFSSHFPS